MVHQPRSGMRHRPNAIQNACRGAHSFVRESVVDSLMPRPVYQAPRAGPKPLMSWCIPLSKSRRRPRPGRPGTTGTGGGQAKTVEAEGRVLRNRGWGQGATSSFSPAAFSSCFRLGVRRRRQASGSRSRDPRLITQLLVSAFPDRAAAPDRDVPGAPGRAGVRPKQSRPKAES